MLVLGVRSEYDVASGSQTRRELLTHACRVLRPDITETTTSSHRNNIHFLGDLGKVHILQIGRNRLEIS